MNSLSFSERHDRIAQIAEAAQAILDGQLGVRDGANAEDS
jgi:hypothetical protein